MKKLLAILDQFEKAVCCFFLAVILLILTYQVATRYIFNTPSLVSEEIARYLYIVFIYLSMSYAEREHVHIRIEMLHRVFPRAARKYVLLLGGLIFLGFSAIMAYVCAEQAIDIYSMEQTSLTLGINMGIVYWGIAIGYILLTVRITCNILCGRYTPADPPGPGLTGPALADAAATDSSKGDTVLPL